MLALLIIVLILLALAVPIVSRNAWRCVLRWLHVLWVCRVSVASVLFGLLLMRFAAPAQDLFADTSFGYLLWGLFFLGAVVCWAVPVHYAARQILERQEWAVSNRLAGPARAARIAALQLAYETPIRWVPRLLGLACFAALALGVLLELQNLNSATALPEVDAAIARIKVILALDAVGAVLFGAWAIGRSPLLAAMGAPRRQLGLTDDGHLSLRRIFDFRHWALLKRSAPSLFLVRIGTLVAVLFMTAVFVAAFIDPFAVAAWLPRAFFMVFMLGAGVFGLTYLAAWSHRLRTPLLLLLGVALVTIATYSHRFHDVRLLSPTEAFGDASGRQITMTQAVERWARANGCALAAPQSCPSAIIVAGQGGASRAAFWTGTFLGELLDRTRSPAAPADPIRPGLRDFGTQIFALSTVSGSSVGAVIARSALVDARTDQEAWRTGPCNSRPDALWFGSAAGQRPSGWRSCLQRLASGDFISPVFVGIAIRDLTSFRRRFVAETPWWQDRATLLERAWEARYDAVVRRPVPPAPAPDHRGLKRPFGYVGKTWEDRDGRVAWTPLLFLNGTSVETGRRIVASDVRPWDCADAYNPGGGVFTYMPEGYDVFEILGSKKHTPRDNAPCTAAKQAAGPAAAGGIPAMASDLAPDFSLSTGGTMSARFPFISPPGQLRNRDGDVIDRIVDGGYFENDGLVTATDLARILIRFGLRPVIVRVTNDPVAAPVESWLDARPEPAPTLPNAREVTWLQSVSTTVTGLINTRSGHGAESAHAAVETVENNAVAALKCGDSCPPHYIHVAIREPAVRGADAKGAYLREIAVSWWLSQPAQAYVDGKLADNLCQIDTLLWHLQPGPDGKPHQEYRTPASC